MLWLTKTSFNDYFNIQVCLIRQTQTMGVYFKNLLIIFSFSILNFILEYSQKSNYERISTFNSRQWVS